MLDASDLYAAEGDMVYLDVRLLGTGAAVPTKVYGKGITVARTGAGVYTLTHTESPGIWAGCLKGTDATTPGDIKNFDVVVTNTSATVVTVNFYNASGTATDLAAAQWINLTLRYKRTSVS